MFTVNILGASLLLSTISPESIFDFPHFSESPIPPPPHSEHCGKPLLISRGPIEVIKPYLLICWILYVGSGGEMGFLDNR